MPKTIFCARYESVTVRSLQYNAAVQLLATFNPTEIGALVRGFREISKTSQRWHVGRLTVFWQHVHLFETNFKIRISYPEMQKSDSSHGSESGTGSVKPTKFSIFFGASHLLQLTASKILWTQLGTGIF